MKRESKISASCQGRPKKASAGPLQRGAEPVAAFGNLTAYEFARAISGERESVGRPHVRLP